MRWIGLLIVFLLAGPSLAQNQAAQPPSPHFDVLYASHDGSGDQFSGWMNTDPYDDDNSGGAVGGDIPQDCVALEVGCEWESFDFTWTWKLNPPLASTVLLDGTIELAAFLGSPEGSGSGIEVSSRLISVTPSGKQYYVAFGETKQFSFDSSTGGAKFGTATWQIPVEDYTLNPGNDLIWTVRARGSAGDAEGSLLMSTGYQRGHSKVTLPIMDPPEPPQPVPVHYHDLNGSVVKIDMTFEEATTEAHIYNWTNPYPDVSLSWRIDGTGRIFVTPTVNSTSYPKMPVSGNNSLVIDKGAGDWSVRVDLSDYKGRLQLTVVPEIVDSETGKPKHPGSQGTHNSDESSDSPEGGFSAARTSVSIMFILAAGIASVVIVVLLLGRRA